MLKNLNHINFSSLKAKTTIYQINHSNHKNNKMKQRGQSSKIIGKSKQIDIINPLIRKNEISIKHNKKEFKKNIFTETINNSEIDDYETSLNISSSEISITGITDKIPKTINQDSYISLKNAFGIQKLFLFGVFDGHGINGHLASKSVKENLISIF